MNINPVFTFSSVTDIDMAIIKLVQKEYMCSYMNPYIKSWDDYDIKCLTQLSEDKNIVKMLMKPEYMDSADNIYEEILSSEKYYDYLETNDIYNLIKIFEMNSGNIINPSIFCRNVREIQYIKNLKNDTPIVEGDTLDLTPYDTVVINNAKDLAYCTNIGRKHIMIARYRYNMTDNDKPTKELFEYIFEYNKIYFISPYSNFEFPKS